MLQFGTMKPKASKTNTNSAAAAAAAATGGKKKKKAGTAYNTIILSIFSANRFLFTGHAIYFLI